MKYEEAIKRLDEIVALLDNGGLSLDESLELYKEGTALAVDCRKMLENAKLQISVASEDNND